MLVDLLEGYGDTRVHGRERKCQVMREREGGGEGGDGGSGWVWGWADILHAWESSATTREGGRDEGVKTHHYSGVPVRLIV